MAEEARHPGPSWSSSFSGYLDSRGQVLQTVTQAESNCQHVAEAGVGEKAHRCLKVWTGSVSNLVKGSGRTELPACFLDPLSHPLAEAGWDGGHQGEGQDPLFTSFSTWQPPFWRPFAESAANCCSVTVAHYLWEFAVRHRKLKWVLCDNLEEWDWVSGGMEFQEGRGHTYAYGWLMLMCGRNQHYIVPAN